MRPVAAGLKGHTGGHAGGGLALVLALCFMTWQAAAAGITAKQIAELLFRHNVANGALDLAGQDLSFLDLAGLDFKMANLAGAKLYGADLSKSSLKGANLERVTLDRASIPGVDFSGANLAGATLLSVAAHATPENNPADAPVFENANLRGAHLAARLDGTNFRNADLTDARLGQLVATWGSWRPRAILNGADFSGATLVRADLSKAVLQFTHFNGADLTRANLANCDLTKADLSGANLSGADVSGADFDGTILTGVTGLDTALGIAAAKNLDKAVR